MTFLPLDGEPTMKGLSELLPAEATTTTPRSAALFEGGGQVVLVLAVRRADRQVHHVDPVGNVAVAVRIEGEVDTLQHREAAARRRDRAAHLDRVEQRARSHADRPADDVGDVRAVTAGAADGAGAAVDRIGVRHRRGRWARLRRRSRSRRRPWPSETARPATGSTDRRWSCRRPPGTRRACRRRRTRRACSRCPNRAPPRGRPRRCCRPPARRQRRCTARFRSGRARID